MSGQEVWQDEMTFDVDQLFRQWHKYETDATFAAWWDAANNTKPCSARMPKKSGDENVTPPTKLSALAIAGGVTPPCLPKPMAKKQLLAAKRLEKELKVAKHGQSQPKGSESGASVEKPKKGEKQNKEEKPKKVVKEPKNEKKPKKKRRPNDGPMEECMKEYIAVCRDGGYSYAEARTMWTASDERRAIIASMTEAERRRRRFSLE